MLDNILQNHHRHFTPGTFSGNVQELSDIILSESNNNFKMKNVSLLFSVFYLLVSSRIAVAVGVGRASPPEAGVMRMHIITRKCAVLLYAFAGPGCSRFRDYATAGMKDG